MLSIQSVFFGCEVLAGALESVAADRASINVVSPQAAFASRPPACRGQALGRVDPQP
jgi:hypothetical protein